METRIESNEVRLPRTDSAEFSPNNKKTPTVSPIKSPASCQYFKSSFARSLSFNTNQSQSLDFELSFRISKCDTTSPSSDDMMDSSAMLSTMLPATPPKPFSTIPKRKYTSNNRLQESKNKSSEIEVLRLRKECQNLIENNRRLMGDSALSSERLNGSNSCVEETLLQTQIDSLQWQLKQVEASRQMYHAVMEEVVRFLDRCHQSLNAMESNQMGRSKSINHVFVNDYDGKARLRSSTNMMDRSIGEMGDVESNTSLSGSYSNFRDFTWRRSPKQVPPPADHNIELNPEKLSQEAFRLLRTAQNLISLKEPSLSDVQSETQSYKNFEFNKTSTLQRKMNSRESRLSIQSSTDDSVHSTSSSRNETDEETHNHQSPSSSSSSAFCIMPSTHMNRKDFIKSMTNTAADDESGFSSMNSFQEIGIPTPILSGSDRSADSAPETIPEDDNDTTIMPSSYMGKTRHPLPIMHRRWDSAPPLPPKRNSLSTYNGDDAPKVLWV